MWRSSGVYRHAGLALRLSRLELLRRRATDEARFLRLATSVRRTVVLAGFGIRRSGIRLSDRRTLCRVSMQRAGRSSSALRMTNRTGSGSELEATLGWVHVHLVSVLTFTASKNSCELSRACTCFQTSKDLDMDADVDEGLSGNSTIARSASKACLLHCVAVLSVIPCGSADLRETHLLCF